jgi:beta-glucuronidase
MSKTVRNFDATIHNEQYLQEFLRPVLTAQDMICDAGRAKESLDGVWNFQVDPFHSFLRSKWFQEKRHDAAGRKIPWDFDFDHWEEVQVPSCWNMTKERYFYYEGAAIYTRAFTYQNKGESRVFLKVGAANYETRLFLNQHFLGYHQGGSTPFYVEVTAYLKDENRIHVVVDNSRDPSGVPMHNIDWFNYGGLYRSVELIRLPETYLQDVLVQLSVAKEDQIAVSLKVAGSNLQGAARLTIAELGVDQQIAVQDGRGEAVIQAHPTLWSPENPQLYEVSIRYGDDQITERIGFRQIKVRDGDLYLNGEKVFFKGIALHEESVQDGKAVSAAEIRENFELAKELGCNYVRLAHYPHTEKAAEIADEVGIMLWEEIPVYWAIDFANPQTAENAQNQLSEMIKRDQNRASVVIWSVGNENPDTDARLHFMQQLAATARRLDPTRLVSAACLVNHGERTIEDRLAQHLDIIGINEYYGWYVQDFDALEEILANSRTDKPVFITEFGAGALAHHHDEAAGLFSEEYQALFYRRQLEILSKVPYIKGLSPWILYDFRSLRRNNRYQRGYNRKGLLSEDKHHRKLAFYELQKFYGQK